MHLKKSVKKYLVAHTRKLLKSKFFFSISILQAWKIFKIVRLFIYSVWKWRMTNIESEKEIFFYCMKNWGKWNVNEKLNDTLLKWTNIVVSAIVIMCAIELLWHLQHQCENKEPLLTVRVIFFSHWWKISSFFRRNKLIFFFTFSLQLMWQCCGNEPNAISKVSIDRHKWHNMIYNLSSNSSRWAQFINDIHVRLDNVQVHIKSFVTIFLYDQTYFVNFTTYISDDNNDNNDNYGTTIKLDSIHSLS